MSLVTVASAIGSPAVETTAARGSAAAAYLELTKPRILLMVLLTIVAGAISAGGAPSDWVLLHALLGTAAVAAGASAANQWIERSRDARMPRTERRPLPAARLQPRQAAWFAACLALGGMVYLVAFTPAITAALAAATWVIYVLIYTPLKPRTPSNTAVGAVAGALPVLIGWTAAGGSIGVTALAWFGIVYLWQFPHFMAIAWLYRDDYRAAGMRMLPVVDPTGRSAGVQSVAAAAALLPISLLPLVGRESAPACALAIAAAGLGYMAASAAFLASRDRRSARRLLRASLVYLPAVMLLLVVSSLAETKPSASLLVTKSASASAPSPVPLSSPTS